MGLTYYSEHQRTEIGHALYCSCMHGIVSSHSNMDHVHCFSRHGFGHGSMLTITGWLLVLHRVWGRESQPQVSQCNCSILALLLVLSGITQHSHFTTNLLTFTCHWVCTLVYSTIAHSWREMLHNRQTEQQLNYPRCTCMPRVNHATDSSVSCQSGMAGEQWLQHNVRALSGES